MNGRTGVSFSTDFHSFPDERTSLMKKYLILRAAGFPWLERLLVLGCTAGMGLIVQLEGQTSATVLGTEEKSRARPGTN